MEETVRIRKAEYYKNFYDIDDCDNVNLEKSKRGVNYLIATRHVATCTIRKLQSHLKEKYNIEVSSGTVVKMKPFYITYASERETILCMCMTCLNLRVLFNVVMEHTKQNNGEVFSSISGFLMQHCSCPKGINGYFEIDCCTGRCGNCIDVSCPICNLDANEEKSFHQFERMSTPYISKRDKKQKISKKTERVQKRDNILFIYNKVVNSREKYLCHHFEVENDKFEWKKTL